MVRKGCLKVWSTTNLSFLRKGKQRVGVLGETLQLTAQKGTCIGWTAIHTHSGTTLPTGQRLQQGGTRGTRRLYSRQDEPFLAEECREKKTPPVALSCLAPCHCGPNPIGQASELQSVTWATAVSVGYEWVSSGRPGRHATPGHGRRQVGTATQCKALSSMAYPVSPQYMYKVAGLAALVCDTICLINVLCATKSSPMLCIGDSFSNSH